MPIWELCRSTAGETGAHQGPPAARWAALLATPASLRGGLYVRPAHPAIPDRPG